jgi:hypothetical protein
VKIKTIEVECCETIPTVQYGNIKIREVVTAELEPDEEE